jgi:hypothetical protein
MSAARVLAWAFIVAVPELIALGLFLAAFGLIAAIVCGVI